MLIFVFLILFLIVLNKLCKADLSENGKKRFCIIAGIILFSLMALRKYTIGSDTIQYWKQFIRMSDMTLTEMNTYSRYEIGFLLFFKIILLFTENPQWMIVFSSAIIAFAVTFFIYNNSNKPLLSFIMFVLMNYYFMSMTAMRQYLAISLTIIGFTIYMKKQTLKTKLIFLALILVGSLFHSAALICIIILLIPQKYKYTNLLLISTMLLSAACIPLAPKIFNTITINTKYNEYVNSMYYEGSNFAGTLYLAISTIFLVLSYYFMYDKKQDFKYNCYLIILSLNTIIYALSINVSIFTRLNSFFDIFNIIYLVNIITDITNKKNRNIILFSFYLFLLAFWIITGKYRPEWYGVLPYSFFFK